MSRNNIGPGTTHKALAHALKTIQLSGFDLGGGRRIVILTDRQVDAIDEADIDENGPSRDLLVWAATPRQATKLWWDYFGMEGDREPEDGPPPDPDTIFVVPHEPPTKPGAVEWHRDIKVAENGPPLVDAILETRANAAREEPDDAAP